MTDEIERLTAERDALRELLFEARTFVFDALDGKCGHQVGLLARIDAALNKGARG